MLRRALRAGACLMLVALACFGQMSRSDRFSGNAYEFSGVAHGTAAVSGNVTTNGSGVMTVTTSAAHGLAIGDRAVLSSCAESGLNAQWTIATVPTTTTFTVTATGVNNANSASCSLQSFKVIATRTFYVASLVIINNSASTRTINIKDLGTGCSSAPCRVGLAKDTTIAANTMYAIALPWVKATSGIQISASDGTSIEYRITGTY